MDDHRAVDMFDALTEAAIVGQNIPWEELEEI